MVTAKLTLLAALMNCTVFPRPPVPDDQHQAELVESGQKGEEEPGAASVASPAQDPGDRWIGRQQILVAVQNQTDRNGGKTDDRQRFPARPVEPHRRADWRPARTCWSAVVQRRRPGARRRAPAARRQPAETVPDSRQCVDAVVSWCVYHRETTCGWPERPTRYLTGTIPGPNPRADRTTFTEVD